MIGLTLIALLALPAQETQQMKVRASTEAGAVGEFEAACMGKLYDRDAVVRTATESKRVYGTAEATADAALTSWNSSYGALHYIQSGSKTTPQCNLTAFTRAPVDRSTLVKTLDAMVRRNVTTRIKAVKEESMATWNWEDAMGRPVTLMWVYTGRTPQQITLSLQALVSE